MLFEDLAYKVYKTKDYGQSMLWAPKLLLGCILLWPDTKKRYLSSTILCFYLSASAILNALGLFTYVAKNYHDFNKLISCLCLVVVPFMSLFKLPVVWYKMKELNNLLNEIKEDFWPYYLVDDETKTTIKNVCNYAVIFMFSMFSFGIVYCTGILSLPLLVSERVLPFAFGLPIDWKKSPTYEIIYFIQVTYIYLAGAIGIVGTDYLVLCICESAANQYRILQKCFQAFNTDEMFEINEKLRKISKNFENKYDIKKEYFIRCARQHDLLLRFTNKLNEALSPVVLGDLVVSVFGICLGTFIASKSETSTMQLVLSLMNITGFLLQLTIDCVIGSDLYYQATLVPACIFKSNWAAIENKEFKKDIMFVIQNSQRYPIFSAYGLYDINMNSFVKVIKLAFSMYCLLTNLSK